MKKAVLLVFCVFPLLFMSACSKSSESYIALMKMTEKELDLVNLIGSSASISHFVVHDTMTIEIRGDLYQNGIMVETKSYDAGTYSAAGGKFAVVPNRSDNTEFDVRMTVGHGDITGWRFKEDCDVDGMLYSDLTNSTEKNSIQNGDPYILYARFFSSDNDMGVPADALTNPERLKDYDYVFMISCEFSSVESDVST